MNVCVVGNMAEFMDEYIHSSKNNTIAEQMDGQMENMDTLHIFIFPCLISFILYYYTLFFSLFVLQCYCSSLFGQLDGWMDGQMNGWMDEWMDG